MLKNRSTFFSIFPPPALLNMPYAGLHITDDAIRVVMLEKKGKRYDVKKYSERLLPKGLVEAGYVTNENALAQELKAIKDELGISTVRVSLPEEKMYLFKIDVGSASDDGVRGVIETKLEENIPIPPGEVIFEYDPYERKNGFITKASVFAFPQKAVNSYLSCCTLAGLTVCAFDTEPRALIRALVPALTEASLIVHISERKTGVYVMLSKVPRFSSTIAIGGETITNAIAKSFSMSPEIARTTKFTELFIEGGRTKEIFSAALTTMSIIKDEISKVMTYWNTHGDAGKIEKIYLVGHDAQIAGYVEYLESNLKTTVLIGDVWAGLSYDGDIPPIEFSKALDYAVAIGLALPEL